MARESEAAMPFDLPSLSREQVRRVDQIAIERFGIPGTTLMERAGRGTAELLQSLGIHGMVTICCGGGNNGGDGFVVARRLVAAGYAVQTLLFAESAKLQGDAAANNALLSEAHVPVQVVARDVDYDGVIEHLTGSYWIVDALLGTGATALPRSPYPQVIRAINTAGVDGVKVLAVDLPSGLDADAGEPFREESGKYGPCVKADITATFVARKLGFDRPASREFTGDVVVIDIGVPEQVVEEARKEN